MENVAVSYKQDLVDRFWQFRKNNFKDSLFDRPNGPGDRPPVFRREVASNNVLLKPDLADDIKQKVIDQIPLGHRHMWFGSMTSSQALTQSVFGNLKVLEKLDCLAGIKNDEGQDLFLRNPNLNENISLEYSVNYLSEPRPTSVDVFFEGGYRVAVECKLSEAEVGSCSRPGLTVKDSNYDDDYCDGRYIEQQGRSEKCSLSAAGIDYWKHIPEIFNWPAEIAHNPCPLHETYQLVRNVLAACVSPEGKLDPDNGHAVLLYDDRNPAFQEGGKGRIAYKNVKTALKESRLLQECTWQRVSESLRSDPELKWLSDLLLQKYGI